MREFSQLGLIVSKLLLESLGADGFAFNLRGHVKEYSYVSYVLTSPFLLLSVCSVWALAFIQDGVSRTTNDVISGTDVIFNLCQDI